MDAFKYIYGPVSSWRLGSSLGIDAIPHNTKVCNFDCLYCQLGRTKTFHSERRIFVAEKKILDEVGRLPPLEVDYVTLSGNGEPTLAKNLGQLIHALKNALPYPVAVITNSSTIMDAEVAQELSLADCVVAKLDAFDPYSFKRINRPCDGISFDKIVEGLRTFRRHYRGKFAIQVMVVEENKAYVQRIASIVNEIFADEVHINTPLRPSACRPLPPGEIRCTAQLFAAASVLNVYDGQKKQVKPISELQTLRRRGKAL